MCITRYLQRIGLNLQMLKNKRILITGGSGVIGKEIVNLIKQDNEICVADVKNNTDLEGISYKRIDLARDSLNSLINYDPEVIFHLAAVFERSEESSGFWNQNYLNNIMLSHRVIDLALKISSLKKFVFASSYLIYDKNQYTYSDPAKKTKILQESTPVSPRNLCGASKYYTEKELQYIKKVHNIDFDAVSARIYRVYGKGSNDVISRWVRSCIKGETIHLWGNENSYDYIHSRDVAKGLIKLAENRSPSIVNLGSGISNSIGDVISLLKKKFPNMVINQMEYTGPYEKSQADVSVLQNCTNWVPDLSIESGINDIINWEKERRGD